MSTLPRSWVFLRDGVGILPASNMADSLHGSNLGPTDLLVREAVQNSLDERRADSDDPVRIRFERRVLTGPDKRRFVDALDLRVLADRRRHFRTAHNWFGKGDSVLAQIEDPDVRLPILAVSDFNTNGLGGYWNRRLSRQDRFFNLALSIGGSLKWEDEKENDTDAVRTLGSYGYGKMVFALNSDLRTVVYYSTFDSDAHTERRRSRAMATAFLPQHTTENKDFAGQAYYGIDSGEPANPRKPLVGRDAHAWARSLGLPKRSEAEPGTTVMVPAAGATMREIVESCDRWWWPRMQDRARNRRVEFEFVDEDVVLPGGRPRSRPELSPFIDCYKLLKAHAAGDTYDLRDVVVKPPGGQRKAGRLVLKAVDPPQDGAQNGGLTNCVALVRDGLVIRYANEFAHEDRPPVVGVFTPGSDADSMHAFVFSEPPAHDDWVANGGRLRGKYAWGRDFIRLTKGRIRSLTRDFQTRREKAPSVERSDAAGFLRKALRDLFASPGSGRPSPKPSARARAFTVEIRDSERRANGKSLEDFVQVPHRIVRACLDRGGSDRLGAGARGSGRRCRAADRYLAAGSHGAGTGPSRIRRPDRFAPEADAGQSDSGRGPCDRASGLENPVGDFRRTENSVMAPSSIAWKAVEHLVTPPFPTSDRSLANVKLRIDMNDEPTSDEDRRIESAQDWDGLTPELFMDVDVAALSADTGAPADDTVVSVVCRDRNLCKFERAATWPLLNLPADGWPLSQVLDRFSRSTRFDVVVVATLRPDAPALSRLSRLSIPANASLATKCFKVRVHSRGLDVPIKFVEPDDLVKQGLDRRSVCFVRWIGEDVTRPPRELLEVWLNREFEDIFRTLSARNAGTPAQHIARNVAAQVYAEVIGNVLLADDHGEEPDSLIQVVEQLLQKELGIGLEDARRQYRSGPGGRARLGPWCWRLAGADEAFASMKL